MNLLISIILTAYQLLMLVHMTRVNSIIDVGTGAGFPRIPFKIAFSRI